MNDTGQLLPDNGVDAMTTVSSDRIRIKLKAYDYRILDTVSYTHLTLPTKLEV